MLFILTNIFLFIVIIILFLLLSAVWPPDSPWAPWWTTKPEVAKKMCELARVNKKSLVYDLGCGTGDALVVIAEKYGAKGVGIEIDPIRYLIAKWKVWSHELSGDITLFRKNFFSINLSPATVLFIYLVPAALKRLTPKLLKELKKGTTIVSYIYPMPIDMYNGKLRLLVHDTEQQIFVYKFT